MDLSLSLSLSLNMVIIFYHYERYKISIKRYSVFKNNIISVIIDKDTGILATSFAGKCHLIRLDLDFF